MKITLFLVAVIAVGLSTALPARLLKHEETHDDHRYTVEYHLDDGTVVRENGVRVPGVEGDVWHKSGSYRFISPEGQAFTVTYTADHQGYQAQGDHLPRDVLPIH